MSEKVVLNVEGMSCGHCKAAVEKGLSALDGVQNVEVDLAGKKATVNFASEKITTDVLKKTISDLGYSVVD